MSIHNLFITKTYLYNFDPLKPHFYIVKLGFTGVYIIFLISAQKHSFCMHIPEYLQNYIEYIRQNNASRKHAYIILTTLNPLFI